MRTFLLCWLLLLAAPWTMADALTIVLPDKRIDFDAHELAAALEVQTITQDDPVYGRRMVFDAYALADILALAGGSAAVGDELVFTAADGYAPTVSRATLALYPAHVAFREHGNPRGFEPVAQGKTMVSPAPYYLVWGDEAGKSTELPRPYQLVSIEVVDFAQRYAGLLPGTLPATAPAMLGFTLFKTHCLRCHAINQVGGDIGPELNVPKNVTEYWAANTLRAFIRDASAFHARSKMPSFASVLGDADIEHLLAYFEAMKTRKQAP